MAINIGGIIIAAIKEAVIYGGKVPNFIKKDKGKKTSNQIQ